MFQPLARLWHLPLSPRQRPRRMRPCGGVLGQPIPALGASPSHTSRRTGLSRAFKGERNGDHVMNTEPPSTQRGNQISPTATSATVGWRNRRPLTGADLTDFLSLRRVCGHTSSSIGKLGNHYVENKHPLLPFVENGLTVSIEGEHLTLGEPCTVLAVASVSRFGLPIPIYDAATVAVTRRASTCESLIGQASLFAALVRSTT